MRHPACKALVLVIAALSVVGALLFFGTASCILYADLYEMDADQVFQSAYAYRAENLAVSLANRCAQKQYSQIPADIAESFYVPDDDETVSAQAEVTPGTWYYSVHNADGDMVQSTIPRDTAGLFSYSFSFSGWYLTETGSQENADYSFSWGDGYLYLRYTSSPEYQVTVYLQEDAVTGVYGMDHASLRFLHSHRYTVLVLTGVCVLVFAGCLVCLCLTAGRRRKGDPVCPGGLNRMPLDAYFILAGVAACLLIELGVRVSPITALYYFNSGLQGELFILELLLSCALVFLGVLAAVGFLFATAAQAKMPERYWWRNTLICRALRLARRMLRRVLAVYLGFVRLLPVMWQWLLTGFAMGFMVLLSILLRSEFLLSVSLLAGVTVIAYGAWAFGKLLKGARQMAQGNLSAKVSTKYLVGAFKTLGDSLNALSDVTLDAADARLRSERMKAELITNVSHDIKTPLTSIINYIDLLPRAENEAQKQEYLQILDRQSQRLKRLIEDLTEMSRASTGNIQTNIAPMDAVEGITQALGEFSDKLSQAAVQVCTRLPEEPVMIEADGRLFWRVMSNLLSNVVKYTMPGTRVYVELTREDDMARISVKNISREPLTKDARELTERFVRGDASRNTEGSGLGLSIAGSLMDVQKGSLQVQLDADLFTATLSFPLVQP